MSTRSRPEEMKPDCDSDFSPEEEKKLVRKIDLFLMPTIWLMYLLSYMDRTKYVAKPRIHSCIAVESH